MSYLRNNKLLLVISGVLLVANIALLYFFVLNRPHTDHPTPPTPEERRAMAIEKIGTFKGDSKFSTWLYRIATTTALDHLRSKKRKKRFGFLQSLSGTSGEEKEQVPDFNHPGVSLDNKERAAVLFKAIEELPENQKVAYTLHKLEGLSYRDVSEVLNTSVSAVESLMSRANQNLRKQLEDYYNKHYR
jgi:RNA polymerase sigma-70 factor (ECF subfamily)